MVTDKVKAAVGMQEHEALMACYKSGQMSEAQFFEHLKDEDFAEYVRSTEDPRDVIRRLKRVYSVETEAEIIAQQNKQIERLQERLQRLEHPMPAFVRARA
jgi:transcription initiation factor IIE alpha subunit